MGSASGLADPLQLMKAKTWNPAREKLRDQINKPGLSARRI